MCWPFLFFCVYFISLSLFSLILLVSLCFRHLVARIGQCHRNVRCDSNRTPPNCQWCEEVFSIVMRRPLRSLWIHRKMCVLGPAQNLSKNSCVFPCLDQRIGQVSQHGAFFVKKIPRFRGLFRPILTGRSDLFSPIRTYLLYWPDLFSPISTYFVAQ